jgi:prepilin-type N-terminal cleavage/methylation domain-containing protein
MLFQTTEHAKGGTPMTPSRRRPAAYTLIELLVVIGIIAVLVGLLVPAVQEVREAANRAQCQSKLCQIVLAFHHCGDANSSGAMPPGIGYYPGRNAYGTALFHVLPYVEQGNLYDESRVNGFAFAPFNGVDSKPVKLFVCPSDPTAPSSWVVQDLGQTWGVASYAANAQVFSEVDGDGRLLNPAGSPRLSASFPDGTSQTILFAEKFARCYDRRYRDGGSLWAYAETGAGVQPLHAGFAISWEPVTTSIGPGSVFQANPREGNCDPTRASTAHIGGMPVGLADGSVRNVSTSVSGTTWWALCTPDKGDVPGPD